MIFPADSYIVINKSIINEDDKKIVIDLYQPIIGNSSISLYFTLLNDLDKCILTDELTHHHILTKMQLSLEELKQARERLEAIGLLKTYFKKGDINKYVYILFSPLKPNDFFNHPILNIVLYNNLGKIEYNKVISAYKLPRISLKDFEDISSNFDQVFTPVPKLSFVENKDIVRVNDNQIKLKGEVDFNLLFSGLENKYDIKIFTKEIKDLITNLSYIYNIDILTMQNLLKSCINEKGSIDKVTLRKSVRDYYQFENDGKLPTVIYNTQPEYLKKSIGDSSNKSKMIYTFENTNPYEFLKSKYKNGKVVQRDLNLLESLLIDLKLTPGVVNVLIDYVLRVNNQKLVKNYTETIASSWKRLGIETVEEAMNECIKKHKKPIVKKQTKYTNVTEKKVPDWFDQKIVKEEVSKEEAEKLKNLLSDS